MFDSTWRRWSWRAGTASALAVALFAVGSPAGAQETVDLADVFNPLVVKALQGADISTELTPLGLSSDDPWFDEPEIEPGTAPAHFSKRVRSACRSTRSAPTWSRLTNSCTPPLITSVGR
ncbi:hypothetical protein ACETU7_19405 [Rhodococcus sp. 3Y1]